MKRSIVAVIALGVVLTASLGLAQNPTGTLSGRVLDDTKQPLPGVTVSLTSPNLQGTRSAVTSVNGDFVFRFLPPGAYVAKFELPGFGTLENTVKISAAMNQQLDVEMKQAKLAEEITVSGSFETISTSNQASSNVTFELMNKLPVVNTMNNYAALAAGTTQNGPSNAVTISGGMSYENLFLVNGVAIMDNLRNTPTALYIEDAVQETTTSTASISAEYGRFGGGVVNMLTKSGGNDFHGSFRLGLDNDKWTAKTPLTVTRSDKLNRTYQATAGGFILRDRLWFFAAGRSRKTEAAAQTTFTSIPYTTVDDDKRYEGKLTAAITPNHRIVASYIDYKVTQKNNRFSTIMDIASLYDRELPSKLYTGNYTGVLTDNFFVEGQFSKKEFAFVGSGSRYTDLIKGTLLLDRSRANARWWSPTFCGICEPEERNNEEYIVKGSYFLSTQRLGTHDIVAGVDQFDDIRKAQNHQSGSDYRIYLSGTVIGPNATLYPVFQPGTGTFFYYQPIPKVNKGTSFKTSSFFVNDKWRLNNNLSFTVGVRYDKNDGVDGEGKKVVNDSAISPRVGMTWDPKADGEWLVNAGYAKYVNAIANAIGDSTSSAGNSATYGWNYGGPAINATCDAATGANCVDTATALGQFFAWFQSIGGTSNTSAWRFSPDLPGGNSRFASSITSPSTDEITVGVTKRFGNRGMVRVDYVNRTFKDFYATRLDTTTGTIDVNGTLFNLRLYQNENNLLERTYNALQSSFNFRVADAFTLGGNYTLSRLYGNWVGEDTTSGPLTSSVLEYPEYRQLSWFAPKGNLGADQRHKARMWLVWDAINAKHHRMSVSLLQSFMSGTPYGAQGNVPLRDAAGKDYVTNPGYITPPTSITYWFTARDAYRTDAVLSTDLSINYSFLIPGLGKDVEFFVQPAVTNVFNRQAVVNPNVTVYTAGDKSYLKRFNPLKDTPVGCGSYDAAGVCTDANANWSKGPNFGKPTATTTPTAMTGSYQLPRTFTISIGARF